MRDSNTQVDHIDDKRYNIAPSLTWNIDDDTRLTFLSQFNRDDTAATSQFLPLRGTKYDAPFGKISHHKNLGDPDWDFYDRTYYWLGYSFERRINDVWQFRQNLRYLRNDLSFQTLTPTSSIDAASADGTLQRMTTSVDEDISQFVVDNNFRLTSRPVRCAILSCWVSITTAPAPTTPRSTTSPVCRRPTSTTRSMVSQFPSHRALVRSMTTDRRLIRPGSTSRIRSPSTTGA